MDAQDPWNAPGLAAQFVAAWCAARDERWEKERQEWKDGAPLRKEKKKQWAEKLNCLDLLTLEEFDLSQRPRKYQPDVCGVYILFDKKKVVYVGQSETTRYRLRHHARVLTMIFDSARFLEVPKDELCIVESLFIRKYEPKYNKRGLPLALRRARANDMTIGLRWEAKQALKALNPVAVDLPSAARAGLGVSL